MVDSVQNSAVSVDPGRLRLDEEQPTEGVLIGMRCAECGIHVFGQAVFCQACSSASLEPADLSRTGTLYSYTIVRVPPDGWPGTVPYILGEVELPEGPHVLAEVIEVSPEDLKLDIAVRLVLQEVHPGNSGPTLMVYKWAPAANPAVESGEA